MAGRGGMLDVDRLPQPGVRLCDTFGQWTDATHPFNRFASSRRPMFRRGYCLAGPFGAGLFLGARPVCDVEAVRGCEHRQVAGARVPLARKLVSRGDQFHEAAGDEVDR